MKTVEYNKRVGLTVLCVRVVFLRNLWLSNSSVNSLLLVESVAPSQCWKPLYWIHS